MKTQQDPIILKEPYPVPSVCTVSVERGFNQPLGIHLKTETNNRVIVDGLKVDSILHRTPLLVKDEILAVNGEAVHCAKQAADIMKAYTSLDITLLTPATRARMPIFCYLEAAPATEVNPGVCFDSCCNRTMVMISDIFLSDPTRTNLKVGDIVLAVNGSPIWKPEEADKEQLLAVRDSKALVLYCVDMVALRDHLAAHVERTRRPRRERRTPKILKDPSSVCYWIEENDCRFLAKVNRQTQMFEDETDEDSRYKSRTNIHTRLLNKESYSSVCLPTFNDLNSLMERQLMILKAKIVGRAWCHSVKTSEDRIEIIAALPSASAAPTVTLQSGSQPSSAFDGIPVAKAVAVDL